MKKRTVPQPSQANDGRERPQICKRENNESERNNDNTNKTTGCKDHSQNTKKLNLENVSEGQSGSSSNANNNKDNIDSSSHESENVDITKEQSCRNRKKRKRSKAKENKNNKGPMKDSTESKSKLNHNSNPEDSSEGHIISQTGSTSFACKGKRETKGISNTEEDNNIDKTNKPSGSKSEVEIADKTNPNNISKGQTNNTRAILQERNPKQKKKEKRSKTTSSVCDTTINKNENNTNKTTEGESLLQGTGTLNLEVISDSHSSSCNNNSNSNSCSNNNKSNDAITKERPCENIIKGKWTEEEENKSNKDFRKSIGSKSEVEITDRANHEASSKSLEAISHDRTAKRKSKEKRCKRKSSVRDSTVNKNDNKCDGKDLQRYFKAVESVNEGHEKRHEESTKSDSTEDNRITKNSKRSTESRSELKSEGKPCPQHAVDAQRTGARPKVFSADRNRTKERKFNKEVCRQDKTVNTNGNKSDKKDLVGYFKAVESTNEGDFCIRTTEHDTNKRRGRQVSSSRDQGGDKLKTNKKDKKLSTATKDTPDQFIIYVKTIAYQVRSL